MSDLMGSMDLTGFGVGPMLNDSSYKQFTMDARWRMIYPAPYFDPIAMQTIMDPKIAMLWGRYFYDWHPIIHAAINKMVAYPITDFIFDTIDPQLKQNYEDAFQKMGVRKILIRMGLDYNVCGNAYLSCLMPFKRMLICPTCGSSYAADQTRFKSSQAKIMMHCNNCNTDIVPEIKDSMTSEVKEMKLILWNPLNMQVEHDELLDNNEYFFSLPDKVKSGIINGENKYLAKYPMYFIEAAHKKQLLKIYNDKILHLRRDTHSASYHKGQGQPLISPVLKYLFHLLVLIRAQDALAIDQILPWHMFSPSQSGGIDPVSDVDLGTWKAEVEKEYGKWKKNPLHKTIMPIPMNAQTIGAQGKMLMLSPEIQEITNQILAGMGVPNEFVYGGLQWTGANVSMRMLENQFINYRTTMQEVLDWIVEQIHVYFGYPKIKVKMQNFKMADDIAQKDLMLNLANNGKLSWNTTFAELFQDIEYSAELEKILEENKAALKNQADMQTATTKVQIRNQREQMAMGLVQPPAPGPVCDNSGNEEQGQQRQRGDLPEQGSPRAEGVNQQI